MNTPINDGIAQDDLEMGGFKILSADLSDYAGDNLTWNSVTDQFDASVTGESGSGLPEGWVSITDYDGVGDARLVTDAAMTVGTAVLTSATAAFTANDVGKSISVNGMGASAARVLTTIIGFTNSTTVTIGATAGVTNSSQYCAIGTDNTTPVQTALAATDCIVYFPPGNYLFAGSIGAVPVDRHLVGAPFFGPRGAVMDDGAIYDESNQLDPMSSGTTFLLTANAGVSSAASSFIILTDNCSVTGITFYWPNQLQTDSSPIAYPWAIHFNGGTAGAVKYCNFVNAYQCIYIENTLFSLVEEIRGQALFRGIKCEGNYDVTRLRGCHFNASWAYSYAGAYMLSNSIAFDFGRNDLLIAEGCFAFGYKTWIHFYGDVAHNFHGPASAWAEIRGGGADWCYDPIVVDECQFQGVDIDGVHISTVSTGNVCVVVDTAFTGSVRIHNSIFLGWLGTFGTIAGAGRVTVDNCHFIGSGTPGVASFATTAWAVTGTGYFTLRDSHFDTTQPYVSLGSGLTRAMLTDNMCGGTNFNVTNSMTSGAVISGNTGSNSTFTVTNLPATPVLGQVAWVTDGTAALAWGATVTGGGSTKYMVWYNGANWTVMGK